jgi:uncharacterized membrane protein
MLALFLGPLQFWTALRRRYARFHRWTGRIYLVSVGIGATMAPFMIGQSSLADWVYHSGLAGLAFAWAGTSALALLAIRRGNVIQHREWMIRSYVVTFGFVAFRIVMDSATAMQFGTFAQRAGVSAWACWAVPLLVTELILQGQKIFRTPRRALPAFD